ncbi:integrase [Streptomyces sp. NPDC014685]|uniref:integrase n=1 Tax=Streptomyces sp. NPDC014685 TaxID=3364881 RepID=UPI0036F838A1
MLLRRACSGMANAFAMLRLLPMSDRDKDVEILALRHRLPVLERRLGKGKVRFGRAFLAALLHRLPREVLRGLRLLGRPDRVLRRHRDLAARRHAAGSGPKRPGRPRTVRSIRAPVPRLARENPTWVCLRLHGGLLVPGGTVAPSTGWEILREAGIGPSPRRSSSTWADFLRPRAGALPACDLFGTATLSGARMYVLTVVGQGSRRTGIPGATAHPATARAAQAAKNPVRDLQDARCRARFLIRDRDGKSPALSDAILADAGIEVVPGGLRMPGTNPIMERWAQTCRREPRDRTLTWNQRQPLHAVRAFGQFCSSHRPHQGIGNARPLHPLPPPVTAPDEIARLGIHRRDRLGGILHEYRHAA